MRVKAVFISICVLILSSQNLFSQRPVLPTPFPVLRTERSDVRASEFYKVGETTGNIGGAKAILLPKPVYPVEAREAGAEGKVKVEITIDESGSVASAKAVSGHPALYEAAQNAALKSKFSVPKVGGEGTKVSGFITYDFLIETPNWFKVGYDIAVIEKLPTLGFFQIPVIKKVIQTDWQTETDLLEQLRVIRNEEKKAFDSMPVERPVLMNNRTPNSASQTMSMRINIPPQNPQKISAAQNLLTALQARLAGDELSLWQLNLGIAFIKVQELYRNPVTRKIAVEILKPYSQNAPANVPAAYSEQLKNLIETFETKSNDETDVRDAIGRTIAVLQKIK
ncbi:MAG: energy transducer TonB [Pyrinomonadaceae bacterium]